MTGKYKPTGSMIGRAKTVGYEITKTGKRKAKNRIHKLDADSPGRIRIVRMGEERLERGGRARHERII